MAVQSVSIVEECERAAALLDPLRLELLARLREPDSAAGLAKALGLPRQRVGYHVKELEKRGLLKRVGERRRRNCLERLVQATARYYTIAPEALGKLGLDPRRVRDRLSSAYLAAVMTQAAREVVSLQERAEQAGQRLATLTIETEVRFATPAAQQGFAAELAEAVKGLAARYHDERAPGGRRFLFVVGGYPAPARGGGRAGDGKGVKEGGLNE